MSWEYKGNDAGICLFDACLKAGAPMNFGHWVKNPDDKPFRVLEVGCCESDWLERAAAAWPDCQFIGIDQALGKDTKGPNWQRIKRNVLDSGMGEDGFYWHEYFDAVVSLSAIEHIGLGHYGDPKDPDGDSKAVANIWQWLKPGGFFYFDVPYDPTGYRVLGTECRIYHDQALITRLYRPFNTGGPAWQFTAYADSKTPGTLVDKPTVAAQRYWYTAMCWRKA